MARRSSLDPVTIAFIVGGIGGDETERIAERIEATAGEQKTKLDRIEALVRSGSAPSEGSNLLFRDLLAVLLAVLAIVALATIAARFASPLVVIAAFGLGIAVTLGYLWAAPRVSAAIRRE